MNLTPNTIAEVYPARLREKAEAIRDAVVTKSVTAEDVGSLFCSLIDAAGSVRDALALFLDTNVGEIVADIDSRLAGADEAAQKAAAETQRCEATRLLVAELVEALSSQNIAAPTRLSIDYVPTEVTLGNEQLPQIHARALPAYGFGSVLFISDNKAVEVTPDGKITPVAVGTSKVHVVASVKTSLYETLEIAVVPPRMRLSAAGALRLDGNGNIRLT